MHKYEFSLILRDALELTDEVADALFAAGCNDGTPGTFGVRLVIDFSRQAKNLEAYGDAVRRSRASGVAFLTLLKARSNLRRLPR
jgi:hypothetical protein